MRHRRDSLSDLFYCHIIEPGFAFGIPDPDSDNRFDAFPGIRRSCYVKRKLVPRMCSVDSGIRICSALIFGEVNERACAARGFQIFCLDEIRKSVLCVRLHILKLLRRIQFQALAIFKMEAFAT